MDYLRWARAQWDRVGAVIFVVAGAIALGVGWFRISDELYPAGQIPYVVSGGLAGLFLLSIGSTLWLSADLRDEWRELHRLREELERHRPHQHTPNDAASPVEPAEVAANGSRPSPPRSTTREALGDTRPA